MATSWALGRLAQRESLIPPSRRFYDYCVAHRSPRLTRRIDTVTSLGDFPVIISFSVLVGGMLGYERRSWSPVTLLTGGFVAEIYLQKVLKRLVHGTVPAQEFAIGAPGDFPSGGAARTVITFGLIAHLLAQRWNSPAERRFLWSVVTAMVAAQGSSRLYLGRHWPEDVVGGWIFGWLLLRTLTRLDEIVSGS